MRVMLDTNVLISAFIFKSAALDKVVEIASASGNRLVLSTFVLDEVYAVVERKWPNRLLDLEIYLALLDFDTAVTPHRLEEGLFEIRDPKDYPVLYTALLDKSDVLVTGDKDFSNLNVGDVEILTPSEFVSRYS